MVNSEDVVFRVGTVLWVFSICSWTFSGIFSYVQGILARNRQLVVVGDHFLITAEERVGAHERGGGQRCEDGVHLHDGSGCVSYRVRARIARIRCRIRRWSRTAKDIVQ